MLTEAEWEYAARGGQLSKGYKFAGSDDVDAVAWYRLSIPSTTSGTEGYGPQPVATKAPNELGLYDMSGNVWEWCADWFDAYGPDAETNPTGPENGTSRVNRGGCWATSVARCRVAYRNRWLPSASDGILGVRLGM